MKRYLSYLILSTLCYSYHAQAMTREEIVHKKDSYLSHFKGISGTVHIEDGVFYIRNNLRVQANHSYVDSTPERGLQFSACGNVMVTYQGKTIVCEDLTYYENTDACLLTNGRFAAYPWFIGGSSLSLTPHTILVRNGYISTSEGPKKHLCLSGESLCYSSDGVLSVGKTSLKLGTIPILVLPKISLMPLEIPRPPINVRGGTGGFLGSYAGISYSPLSRKYCRSTFFLDSFFKHGLGLGYTLHIAQKEHPENFIDMKSYYAHRLAIDMPKLHDRYRFHGRFSMTKQKASIRGEYHISDSWETVADIFPNNFSLKNTGPTTAQITWRDPFFYGSLTSSVKVNPFQNVNQELPKLRIQPRPIPIHKTGIFLENAFECGYFDFSFSDHIEGKRFSSLRAAITPKLYRSFPLIVGTLTPSITPSIIYYSSTPKGGDPHYQAWAKMHIEYRLSAYKHYLFTKHILEPFASFTCITHPIAKNNEHYIFSIQDAASRLTLCIFGIDSQLLTHHHPSHTSLKVWTTCLLKNESAKSVFPKTACVLSLPLNRKSSLSLDVEWIWKKSCWDHFNLFWKWVGNDNLALSLEFLHRSKYSLKKCNHENFILDVSRLPEQLFNSILSDQRNLVLGKLFVRPHPCWDYQLTLRYGWHRENTPNYLEYQMTLGTKIFEHWRLYSVYEKREADKRCFFYLKLDKPK